jgi:hypothetical protein
MGTDLEPYTRLFRRFRERILGDDSSGDPAEATFADGVANQRVLDAVRSGASSGAWVDVTP